jgi:hypothetical protein
LFSNSRSKNSRSTTPEHHPPSQERIERQFTFPSTAPHGIDVAVLIAVVSAVVDVLSLFEPWLLGLNDEYVTGKGLTYAVGAEVSGFRLLQNEPYLAILLVPVFLTGLTVILAMLPEDTSVRMSYKMKSGILLAASIGLSLYPSYVFMNNLAGGVDMTRGLNEIVSFWAMGSGATLPAYAGIGFAAALVVRIFKD